MQKEITKKPSFLWKSQFTCEKNRRTTPKPQKRTNRFRPTAAATVYKLALDLGKFPVVVADGPGAGARGSRGRREEPFIEGRFLQVLGIKFI